MYGFATEALLLFPKYEFVSETDYRIKANLRLATENMCKFLRSRGITPKAFITDDVARLFSPIGFGWVSTLSPGDLYFMSKNCDMASHVMSLEADTFPEIYEKVEEKLPYPTKADIETRFEIMCERDKKVVKAVIPKYKIVVHFYQRGAINYSVASKPDDGRIRLVVDLKNFMCTPYFGGKQEDAIDLIGANFASRAVTHWEV